MTQSRFRYDRFSGCTQPVADNSALWALAQLHHSQGIYDPSCAVTGDEVAIYRAFYKTDLGGDIKAGIKARKARDWCGRSSVDVDRSSHCLAGNRERLLELDGTR